MAHQQFRTKILASSIAVALSSASYGQTQNNKPQLEEIVVTGIRSSLTRSMDIKRDSIGVVDAISAEDIGKFPDTNLAESLQRISGVSISRVNGEGSEITVRGFGADYNMITLNGRMMPSATLAQNGGGGSASRAFDMSNLAAESINAVEVYKTGKASVAAGGIGATINIKTLRPLDDPGFKLSIGAKALHDTTNDTADDITPEVSGLFSWTNASERFGVSLSASYQERDSATTGAYVTRWDPSLYDGTIAQSPGPASGAPINITNAPDIGQLYSMPTDLRYTHADRERERTNAQLTLQVKPIETITTTLDYTYSEQTLFENRSELSIWMDSYKSDLVFDDKSASTPYLAWEERREQAPRDAGQAVQQQNQKNKNESLGFNVQWDVNSRLSLAFDAHHSTAKALPDADFGNWINIGLGANISGAQGIYWNNGLPIMMIDFDDSDTSRGLNNNGVLDKSEIGSAARQLFNNSVETEIDQFRIDTRFDLSDVSSIDFGIESRLMENHSRRSIYQDTLEGGWGVTNPGDVPAQYLDPINYGDLFEGYSTSLSGEAAAFFSDVSDGHATPLLVGYTGDAAVIGEHLSSNIGLGWEANPTNETDRLVEEDILSAYVQFNHLTDVFGLPTNVSVGLRYSDTDVTSTSFLALPEYVEWQSNNDFQIPAGTTISNVVEDASYDHFLPNIDINVDVYDDVKARFSFSKTIARSTYGNLRAAAGDLSGPTLPTSISGSLPGTASTGNPGLLPLESDNYDASIEWYFGETSYVSVGYFEKHVENFIGTETVTQSLYGLTDPTAGPRAQAALDELNERGIVVNDTTLFAMVAAHQEGQDFFDRTLDEWEAVNVHGNADDPLMQFRVNRPVNNQQAQIDGWEFAVQYFLGETGWGVLANYTLVDGDVGYDISASSDENQFALYGLSDTANLVLMYEKYGLQARIAYNWRDDYLKNIVNYRPTFVEDYSQVDFNVAYQFTEQFSVALEGLNVTEEDAREYGRDKTQLERLEILGARYQLSARYTF